MGVTEHRCLLLFAGGGDPELHQFFFHETGILWGLSQFARFSNVPLSPKKLETPAWDALPIHDYSRSCYSPPRLSCFSVITSTIDVAFLLVFGFFVMLCWICFYVLCELCELLLIHYFVKKWDTSC